MVIVWALVWMYVLFLGFLIYAAAKRAWPRLKIGIKVLLAPALLAFGLIDVLFNIVIGTILFLELPTTWTFSQRCSRHLHDAGWRGSIAGAFSVPLNVVDEGHVR